METSESFHDYTADGREVKKELSQEDRTIKNKRWSDLFYKLRDESLTAEEKGKIEVEKEKLRKQIT